MLGVPYLSKSIVYTTCEQCKANYEPGAGGYCAQCDRLLCQEHYHGSRLQRLLRLVTNETRCVSCARARAAS